MREKNKLQLVTFEQAKKLKEMGFDWRTSCYYIQNNEKHEFVDFVNVKANVRDCMYPVDTFTANYNAKKDHFSAPTIALAIKWFRDVERFMPYIRVRNDHHTPVYEPNINGYINNAGVHSIYESAESALLDELLKLES